MDNSRGDVVAMFDTTGTELARYSYDAWGNCTVTTPTGAALTDATHIANINPLRYRGYYLDTDTGLYYLQSRYYDPMTHRFLNADDESIATDDLTALSDKNLFVYCDNNPLIRADDEGEFWHFVIGAAAGAIVGAVSTMITNAATGKAWNEGLAGAVIGGAASGFVASTGVGLLGSIGWNALIGVGSEGINQAQKGELSVSGLVQGAALGAVGGAIGGRGMINPKTVGAGTLKNASKQLTKRIGNSIKYSKSFSTGTREIGKAVRNYAKNTTKLITKGVKSGIIKPAKYTTTINVVSKWSMGYWYSTGR